MLIDNTSDYRVRISTAGVALNADEQRFTRLDRLYVEIKLGALGGALLTITGLVLKQLLGL